MGLFDKLKSKKLKTPKIGLPLASGFLMVILLVMFPMALVFIIFYSIVFFVPNFSIPIEHSGLFIAAVAMIVVLAMSVIYFVLLVRGTTVRWGDYKGGSS